MIRIKSRHLLTGSELSSSEIYNLLILAQALKHDRDQGRLSDALVNRNLAVLFDKPSLRTRFSFMIAMQELGGNVVESIGMTRKEELPEDLIRVLQGYCHGIMMRTHSDEYLARMAEESSIPIINALSDQYHPCQTLADLMTLREIYGNLDGLHIAYIGNGNNVLHSMLLMAPALGIKIHYACPRAYEPEGLVLEAAYERFNNGAVKRFDSPNEAVVGVDAVYTDVWTSMGFEAADENAFTGYQVDEALMAKANPKAIFMHCMPMERGKEVSHTLPDASCSMIFQQSENRLHVQKALLLGLMG